MKKICICGHFGYGLDMADGQTIKTKNIAAQMVCEFGKDNVKTIDTHGRLRMLLKLPFLLLDGLKNTKNMVIMPDQNGVKVIPWIVVLLNICFHRSIHYIVIGGWLPSFLSKHKYLASVLKTFSGIYVETTTMQKNMMANGFDNVCIMPNFKPIKQIDENDLHAHYSEPYKLCIFSRVCKEKGIEDAIRAVNDINVMANKIVYEVDIYGRVDPEQKEWFDKICNNSPEWFKYHGVAASNDSVRIISKYFLLLFPTHYYTEGIPGTIIDAFFSGVPVVYSKWESSSDILNDQIGFGYDFYDKDGLRSCLEQVYNNPDIVIQRKKRCWKEAEKYIPHNAVSTLMDRLAE